MIDIESDIGESYDTMDSLSCEYDYEEMGNQKYEEEESYGQIVLALHQFVITALLGKFNLWHLPLGCKFK